MAMACWRRRGRFDDYDDYDYLHHRRDKRHATITGFFVFPLSSSFLSHSRFQSSSRSMCSKLRERFRQRSQRRMLQPGSDSGSGDFVLRGSCHLFSLQVDVTSLLVARGEEGGN